MNRIAFWLMALIVHGVHAVPVNMYVIYTPSHAYLYEHFFLPSFKKYCADEDINLVVNIVEQSCPTACFKRKGWKNTTLQKVEMIIDAIYKTWNYYFIYSDVDVQFFGPIKSEIEMLLQEHDLVIQKDHPKGTLCSGFFACKSNEKTLALWQDVYQTMQTIEKYSDQGALNHCLIKKNNPYAIKWAYLPSTYFGGATHTGCSWSPGQCFFIPQNPKMHHANWTVGVEHKKEQLWYVQRSVALQR